VSSEYCERLLGDPPFQLFQMAPSFPICGPFCSPPPVSLFRPMFSISLFILETPFFWYCAPTFASPPFIVFFVCLSRVFQSRTISGMVQVEFLPFWFPIPLLRKSPRETCYVPVFPIAPGGAGKPARMTGNPFKLQFPFSLPPDLYTKFCIPSLSSRCVAGSSSEHLVRSFFFVVVIYLFSKLRAAPFSPPLSFTHIQNRAVAKVLDLISGHGLLDLCFPFGGVFIFLFFSFCWRSGSLSILLSSIFGVVAVPGDFPLSPSSTFLFLLYWNVFSLLSY